MSDRKKDALPAGFEPTRGDPIGFQVQRLNHSATNADNDQEDSLQDRSRSTWLGILWTQFMGYQWLDGLGVWFALRVREVPGSNPGQAQRFFFSTRFLAIWLLCLFLNNSYYLTFKAAIASMSRRDERGSLAVIQWVKKVWRHTKTASIAQWQSTGLVNQGSRVQSSLEAWRAGAQRFMWPHCGS